MKARYIKKHNNYDLTVGNTYDVRVYSSEWLLVEKDDGGNRALYRKNCFAMGEEPMKCMVCGKEVEPLDAHMGRINGELGVCHINCWNKHLKIKSTPKGV